MPGKADVLWGGAVTVEDGGHLVPAAHATGGTLAELGSWFGCDAYLGRDVTLLSGTRQGS